ncbi:MAG: sulfatase-like hydrolase/transferase [Bryobacteraceae bacterium]
MLSRRTFLQGSAAALQAAKPNFLFILADDHAGYVLGADGNSRAETPNLDRLASQGTRFASHFCNSPVCTPSRQSFLTGQMPHAAGVTVLKTPLDGQKPTIAKQLKQAGYQTAVFGKMHFNRQSEPGLHGFDHLLTEQDLAKVWTARESRPIPKGIATKPPWKPFADPARIWLNAENLPYPRHEADMRSATLLDQAARYLKENRGKQTATWVSFQEPHSPYDFPLEDRNHFTASQFKAPVPGKEDAWQIPLIFRDLSDEEKQGIAAAYYNSVRYLDRNIGRLLELVDDSTVIVYMADHGYSLGQHGRFEKHCCYEPALRVPLIIRWPAKVRRGVVTDMTESIDIAPTILDLLRAPPLSIAHGQSLRSYLEGKRPAHPRDHIFSEYLENEEACIRTAQYKFIHCSGKRERTDGYKTDSPTPGRYIRLYDLKADPGEFTDLAAAKPKVVAELQALMLKRFRDTHPEASSEPKHAATDEILDWYLRPRDA